MDLSDDHYDPTKKSLLVLNDDCLLEIFSYLDIDALCNFALAHKRLRGIAELIFESKSRTIISSATTKKRTELVLKTFGHLCTNYRIKNVWHSYADYSSDLLYALTKYCSGNLKRLYLERIVLKGEVVEKSRSLFESLEKLTLTSCSNLGRAFSEVFQYSNELKSLKVYGCEYTTLECDFIMHHFPKLESVRFCSLSTLEDYHLKAFIEKNPNLKKLKINDCPKITTSIYEVVSQHLKSLKDLRICEINFTNEENIMHITKLTNLKKLNVKCHNSILPELLSKLESKNTLTHLQINSTCATHELIESIIKMRNLVFLKFYLVVDLDRGYTQLIKRKMKNLRQIHLTCCSPLSTVIYLPREKKK